MFDHVDIRVSDLAASAAAYEVVLAPLGLRRVEDSEEIVDWGAFSVVPADAEHPVTRNLHIAFRAPDRATVDAVWHAAVDAGWAPDGDPGPRPHYGDTYHGGFLRDRDGNSVEVVHGASARAGGVLDHLWIRVADVPACRAFYLAVADHTGFALVTDEDGLARFASPQSSFTLVTATPEWPAIVGLHVAFAAGDRAPVDAFHAAALAAGGVDHGGPGERPAYGAGYCGAFVLDPAGTNAEVVRHGAP